MNRIRWRLEPDSPVEEHLTLAPKALLRIGYGRKWSSAVRALVDTGSPVTIISLGLARKLGWRPPPGEASLRLGGLGAQEGSPSWKATMDVAFVRFAAQKPDLGLVLRDSTVYISDLAAQAAQGEILIGQHDSLERLRFLQRNQHPHLDFMLEIPNPSEP